jgi:hypothetical protein
VSEDDKYYAAIEARIRALAPELTVETRQHDEDQATYVLLVRHTRTGKSRDMEIPEDPVWDAVDNLDKREEAKIDKIVLETRDELSR